MECCSCAVDDYVDDDNIRVAMHSDGSNDSASTDDSRVLNTDYRRVTPLFRNIEKENWEGVLMFLNTGKWSNSLLSSSNSHLRSPGPEIQIKTWVTSYDRNGEPEWSQLPVHAAISYLAPYVVIQKMIQLYPRGIHCTDNEGMLPVHLAFGFGAPDNVIALLLEPFPESINEKGLGGRYPYECCELGPHKTRGKVLRIVSDQIVSRSRMEMEDELREFASQAVKTVGLKRSSDLTNKEMTQFILELLQDRKELDEMKSGARARAVGEVDASLSWSSPKNGSPGGGLSPSSSRRNPPLGSNSSSPKNNSAASSNRRKQKGGQATVQPKMAAKPPSNPRTSKGRTRDSSARQTPGSSKYGI